MNLPQLDLFPDTSRSENPEYLRSQLITYIGSKRALLPFITKGLAVARKALAKERVSILDLFSGTGVVARMVKQYANRLIVNDLEKYSRVVNECYLSNFSEVDEVELARWHEHVTAYIEKNWHPGFITELYAATDEDNITARDRVFFTRRNAIYLDMACQAIATVPDHLRRYFLGPLLSEASVHTNTSGVFKGFYKNSEGVGQFGGAGRNALTRILKDINIPLPVLSNFECDYEVLQSDANALIRDLDELDIAYFDPPYNQHPYGSNYFMLNTVCDYQRPREYSRVSGIPTNWNRSRYNKSKHAEIALLDAIDNCPAKLVLISYNSEGFIPYDHFISEIARLGDVSVMDTKYNTFRGCRNLGDRDIHVTEFLFLVDKR